MRSGSGGRPVPDNPALVIFDFDGVVADSEVISLTSLRETLRDFSFEMSLDDVRRRFLGASLEKIVSTFVEGGRSDEASAFKSAWEAALFARFRAELSPVPGVAALLDRLKAKGLPYCIASSGTLERIGVALEAMSLTDRFPHVFSAEHVTRGKPAPDLFLHAAAAMDARPEECLVIEDSPFGITGARRAGMRRLGFTGGAHLAEIREAHAALLKEAGAETVVDRFDGLFSKDDNRAAASAARSH